MGKRLVGGGSLIEALQKVVKVLVLVSIEERLPGRRARGDELG
jgi:hypothetical protein